MKKQFFYAAFAIAMMASCTNEENPVVDQPTQEEDKVAIELGVNTPNIVVSRGTGTVGGVAGETNATTWNGQTLNIIMVDKNGLKVNEETTTGETYIFEGLTFKAPTGTDDNIKIYAGEATNGIIQHKYYPVNGTFEFYGYHKDDAVGGTESFTTTEAKVTGLTIDGSQDILAASTIKLAEAYDENSPYMDQENTLLTNTNWVDMFNNQFSARTARNGITPILNFEHQLARLRFYVKSGNAESGAVYEKVDDAYTKRSTTENIAVDENDSRPTYELHNGAIYITDIIANDMADVIDLDLKEQTASKNGTSTTEFYLKSSPAEDATDKTLTFLEPVAPMFPINAENATIDEDVEYSSTTPVGESMMFYPVEGTTENEIILTLNLLQRVLDQELEEGATGEEGQTYPKYIDKKMTTQVKLSAPEGGFKVGSSYDVFITIYSLEEIKISAQLTAWTDGGDVDVDIENDVYTEDTTEDENTEVGGN